MKTKFVKVCDAVLINVMTDHNDITDIKCGGPATLGFEFYVDPDRKDEFVKYVKDTLKEYHISYIDIRTRKEENFMVKRLWSKKMIKKCVEDNKDFVHN